VSLLNELSTERVRLSSSFVMEVVRHLNQYSGSLVWISLAAFFLSVTSVDLFWQAYEADQIFDYEILMPSVYQTGSIICLAVIFLFTGQYSFNNLASSVFSITVETVMWSFPESLSVDTDCGWSDCYIQYCILFSALLLLTAFFLLYERPSKHSLTAVVLGGLRFLISIKWSDFGSLLALLVFDLSALLLCILYSVRISVLSRKTTVVSTMAENVHKPSLSDVEIAIPVSTDQNETPDSSTGHELSNAENLHKPPVFVAENAVTGSTDEDETPCLATENGLEFAEGQAPLIPSEFVIGAGDQSTGQKRCLRKRNGDASRRRTMEAMQALSIVLEEPDFTKFSASDFEKLTTDQLVKIADHCALSEKNMSYFLKTIGAINPRPFLLDVVKALYKVPKNGPHTEQTVH